MNFPVAFGSVFFTIFISVCVCASTLIPLGVTGFFLYRMFSNMGQNNSILKTGVQAPAVILNVEDTGTTMNDNPQVRFTLQVNPYGQPPFQAVTTSFVSRLKIGMLTPGAPATVRYDPNDRTKVAIETLGPQAPNNQQFGQFG